MIISLRGTSGSGKSTIVFTMLKQFPHREIKNGKGKIMGYEIDAGLDKSIYALGSYHTACGGCDGIGTQQEAADRAIYFHECGGHVIMEGLLMSAGGPTAAVTATLHETGEDVYAILDTPLSVCLDRVRARRLARGDERPLNTANTEMKWKQTMQTAKTLAGLGYDVRVVDHGRAFEDVMDILRSAQ